jgi:hypothetical protein
LGAAGARVRPDAACALGALGVALLGAASCVNLGEEPVVTIWEADIMPTVAYPDFSGQAAAVSRLDGTSVGIGIDGGAPDAEYAWALRLGTCAAPGTQFGTDDLYPTLLPDPVSGTAEAETQLGSHLSLGGSYHVEVRESLTNPTRVGCGDLVAR